MTRHILWVLFLLTIKSIDGAYLLYPECLEDVKGCDPCDEECKANQKFVQEVFGIMISVIAFILAILLGIWWYDISCGRKTDQFLKIHHKQNQDITDEWQKLRKKLHDQPAILQLILCTVFFSAAVFYFFSVIGVGIYFFSVMTIIVMIPILLCVRCCFNIMKNNRAKQLQIDVREPPIGSWKEHRNMNLLKKSSGSCPLGGGVMLIHDWRNKTTAIDDGTPKTLKHIRLSETPIDDLKRIVEQSGFSAITIYDDYDHAVIRNFEHQLSVQDCEPTQEYNCSTFIYTSTDWTNHPSYPDPAVFGGGWKLVRHKIDDGLPFQASDRLGGTSCYGKPDGNPFSLHNWSIKFNNMKFDQFLFTTWDYKIWAIIKNKDVSPGPAGRSYVHYIKTYNNNRPHGKDGRWREPDTGLWISADGYSESTKFNYLKDPMIKPMTVYADYAGTTGKPWGGYKEWAKRYKSKTSYAWPVGGGMNIFIRDSCTSFTPPNKQTTEPVEQLNKNEDQEQIEMLKMKLKNAEVELLKMKLKNAEDKIDRIEKDFV